jgi:AraC-like DNA-binding protein
MHEEIMSFYTEDTQNLPFCIEMAGISYCDGTYKIERRNSNIYCFEYIIKGRGTVVINDEIFTPSEGDVYILHRGSNHRYFSDKENPWIKIWFNVKGALTDHLIEAYKINNIYHVPDLNIKNLFFDFLDMVKSPTDTKEDIFNKTSILFHQIVQKIHQHTRTLTKTHNPVASALKDYMDRHIADDISLKELSELVFKSPSQTIRVFKKEYGITPYDYLLMKKIETAKLLLRNTNLQVSNIAFRLNFADEHYFSNFFKAKVGKSPAKFRENE